MTSSHLSRTLLKIWLFLYLTRNKLSGILVFRCRRYSFTILDSHTLICCWNHCSMVSSRKIGENVMVLWYSWDRCWMSLRIICIAPPTLKNKQITIKPWWVYTFWRTTMSKCQEKQPSWSGIPISTIRLRHSKWDWVHWWQCGCEELSSQPAK